MVDYSANWRKYKRLKTYYFIGSWAVLVAFVGFLHYKFNLVYTDNYITPLGFILSAAYVTAIVITGYPVYWFRCPRCGKFFSAKRWSNRGLNAKSCVHCGLPRYANSDAAVQV
jgi:hypothetical protein